MGKDVRQTKTAAASSIVGGVLYFEDVPQCRLSDDQVTEILNDKHLTSIRLISLSYSYVESHYLGNGIFNDETVNAQMTLRKEIRHGIGHWYAYRRVFGKLHKRYVGQSDTITEEKLLEVARKMPST